MKLHHMNKSHPLNIQLYESTTLAGAPAVPPVAQPAGASAAGGANPFAGMPGMEALGNPAQLAQMLQAMPPQEQQAMAQMMGMDVNQLQQLATMISAMPPEQVQQHMSAVSDCNTCVIALLHRTCPYCSFC